MLPSDKEDARESSDEPVLQLRDLHAFYGASHVLQGVSLTVRHGEIVSLLGRNGSGRSTLLKAIMGLASARGSVRFKGAELVGLEPFRVARLGLGYVPEGRDVFARLTVQQNLELGRKAVASGSGKAKDASSASGTNWTIDDMYRLFPPLHTRRRTPAGVLSGGEQQMLALCRTLMGNPELMLVDEPTEGLAPALVEQVAGFLVELKARGVSVLLVEQKLAVAMAISQRCYLLGRGQVVFEGPPDVLSSYQPLRQEWLEV